jgi:hypothetical protein
MSTAIDILSGPIETSQTLGKLLEALAKAQGKIEGAKKDKVNPHFKSRYADLAAVWDACREPLSAHGLAVIQLPVSSPDMVGISTTLGHSSGEWIRGTVWTKPQQPGPQALGSVVSYLRRYALAAAVGVAPDDDDGESAQGRGADGPKAQGGAHTEQRPANGNARPASPRASDIPHDGKKATPEQVKKLHTLKGKVGGLSDDAYRRQLAVFKDQQGQPITTSKDLSERQIKFLMDRYELKIAEQAARAAQVPDIGAVVPDMTELAAQMASKGIDEQELCGYVGADSLTQLDRHQSIDALSLVMAWETELWPETRDRVLGKYGMRE